MEILDYLRPRWRRSDPEVRAAAVREMGAEDQGRLEGDRVQELQVFRGERPAVAPGVEVDRSLHRPGPEGNREDGADAEAVDAARGLEGGRAADVGGEDGQAGVAHVAQDGEAQRPLVGRGAEREVVKGQGTEGAVRVHGEDGSPLRLQVSHERVQDPADHRSGIAGLEELARDLVEAQQALPVERAFRKGPRRVEGRFGVGRAFGGPAPGTLHRSMLASAP